MSNHTPEPWNDETHDCTWRETGGHITAIYRGMPDADYDRAVACVNACAGLDVAKVAALLDAIREEARHMPQTMPWFKAVDAVRMAAWAVSSDMRSET